MYTTGVTTVPYMTGPQLFRSPPECCQVWKRGQPNMKHAKPFVRVFTCTPKVGRILALGRLWSCWAVLLHTFGVQVGTQHPLSRRRQAKLRLCTRQFGALAENFPKPEGFEATCMVFLLNPKARRPYMFKVFGAQKSRSYGALGLF